MPTSNIHLSVTVEETHELALLTALQEVVKAFDGRVTTFSVYRSCETGPYVLGTSTQPA